METPLQICTEEQMRFIQRATNATRQEIMQTVQLSRISVEEIIACLKKAAKGLIPARGESEMIRYQ